MRNLENIKTVLKFMPSLQAQCFVEGLMGEEHKYFEDVADNMAQIIKLAPALYETDGLGEEVKPVLHYFWGNVDIYITEIDKSGNGEHFGYTSLGMGYLEFGNMPVPLIFQDFPALNLDFGFIPEKISILRMKHEGI